MSPKRKKKPSKCPILATAINDLEPLKGELVRIKTEVDDLSKTVFKGNGKPAIITQLSDMQGKLKSHHEQINMRLEAVDEKMDGLQREIELKFKNVTDVVTERFNNLAAQITGEFGRRQAETSSMWNFKTAVTTSVIAAIVSIATAVLHGLLSSVSSLHVP